MNIPRIISASKAAISDVKFLHKGNVRQMNRIDQRYYVAMAHHIGKPKTSFIGMAKELKNAYRYNCERLAKIDEMNKPFQTKSFIRKLLGD